MTLNPHLDGALTWHDKGFTVIPAIADGTKRPFARWKEFQSDRPTREQVERWYKTTPDQGVGLICGQASGNLEMLELEGRASSGDHLDKIDQAAAKAGILWLWTLLVHDGYCESTPSGGLHFLYRIADHPVPGNQKIANRPPDAEELKASPLLRSVTLAETRGEGGYVVVAPSSGKVHKSGEAWTCLAGRIGEVPTITWEQRELLVAAIHEALDEMPETPEAPPRPAGIPTDNGEGPGADFNRKTDWGQLLSEYGWTFHSRGPGSELYYTRPGKEVRDGQSASLYYQGSDNLYVWSSGAGLPTEEPISKFAFYAFMEHNGNFSDAARALRRQGFGGERQPMSNWVDEIPLTERVKSQSLTMPDFTDIEIAMDVPAVPKFALDEYTETGVAHAMVNLYGRQFRNVFEEKAWRVYQDGVWIESKRAEVDDAVEIMTKKLKDHTGKLVDTAGIALANARLSEDKDLIAEAKEELKSAEKLATFAAGCRSDRGHKAVKSRFGTQKAVACSVEQFDADKNVIAVDNGVLDLSDLSVTPVPDVVAYPHAPELMLTKKIGVKFDPDAQAPRWRRYLEEVLPDAGYRGYLQRAIGMTLLGDTSEAAFFVLHGQTGCGKSVFFEVMQEAFGDFAATAAPNTFRDTKDDGSRRANDLHALRGTRFVATSETSERTMLNEELVKRVTGGDEISSHALYQSNISWKPQFTIFMASNFRPKLNAGDGAIWRRVKPIEFPNTFYNEDGSAKEAREGKLGQWMIDNELAGIFNWILEGVRAYLTEGLGEPPALREAVKEYREESDGVSEFLANASDEGIIVLDPKSEVTVAQAYSVYVEWVRQNNGFPMGKIKFGNRMTELGYEAVKNPGGIRVRRGIGINPHTWQAQAQGGTRPQSHVGWR